MSPLRGFQKRYLRGLAHKLKPVVLIGRGGISAALLQAVAEALEHHELIKAQFVEVRDKNEKQRLGQDIATATGSQLVGLIGHRVVLFKPNRGPAKSRIRVPEEPDTQDRGFGVKS